VAEGYPWEPGDNIVTLANEFPSNLFPWLNQQSRGVEVRQVPVQDGRVDPNRISEACDQRTRVVAISWVGYASGWRIDVDQICEIAHRHGALLMLDAIQGLGVFPIDVKQTPVDVLAADGHKWMLGPEGAGICFIRKEHLATLRPIGVGWNSVQSSFNYSQPEFKLRDAAARYEGGTQNMSGMMGLSESIDLLMQYGTKPDHSAVGDRVIEISEFACNQLSQIGCQILSPRESGHESGIVTFQFRDHEPDIIRAACRKNGVVVSCRGGGIRLSPHAYVNESDIDRLLGTLLAIE
jgi:selenocysteine lyase/cysteine desulfurase